MTRYTLVGCAVLAASSVSAKAPTRLSFDDVVRLARQQAPVVRLAREDTQVVRGQRITAAALASSNPAFETNVGNRWGDARTTDVELALMVATELGGKRASRIAVADSWARLAYAQVSDVERITVVRAARAYFRVLHASQMRDLMARRRDLASQLLTTARERRAAGDAAEIEVNLAAGELSRAASRISVAERALEKARSRLALVLGLESAIWEVSGSLDNRSFLDKEVKEPNERSDVRIAQERVALASDEISLAKSSRWPDVSFRITYAQEEAAHIVTGGLSITLPLFEHGQGGRAQAYARKRRAQIALESVKTALRLELGTALEEYRLATQAAALLAGHALPIAEKTERMAKESYAAGKIDLTAFLVIRRETLDTQREALDLQLEAALAAVNLWGARGAPTKGKQ